MIIQIDHIAMSSMAFKRHSELLNSLDYQLQFVKEQVRNPRIKRELMAQFGEVHDIALFVKDGNIGIELLDHKHINDQETYMTPVFENVPASIIETVCEKRIAKFGFTEAVVKSLDVPVYIKNGKREEFRFNKVVVETCNFKKSLEFWQSLSFKLVEQEHDIAVLKFQSLLKPDIFYIYLQDKKTSNNTRFLDDKGFNCIAFISNSARGEKKVLEGMGIMATEVEKICVDEKALEIFLVRGPGGELVEIVSLAGK